MLVLAFLVPAVLPESFAPGRTAVITGAAAGLGRAAALKCATLGMQVCLIDIDADALEATTAMVADVAVGGEAAVMSSCIDVSDRGKVISLCDAVYARFGEVGFLLSNAGAGIGSPSALRDYDKWTRSLDVNFNSALHVLQAFVPKMLAQGTRATVVTTGSKQGITMPPGNLAYNVAKAGLKALTEGLQHELRSSADNTDGRLQAHLFVPGFVNTDLAINYFKELKGDAFDEDTDVPWSEEKPSAGGWMPMQSACKWLEPSPAELVRIARPLSDVGCVLWQLSTTSLTRSERGASTSFARTMTSRPRWTESVSPGRLAT